MNTSKRTIDGEILHVLDELKDLGVSTKEYKDAVDNLKVLCEARGHAPARIVSIDTIILAGTNILGILLVLYFEELHVVSKNALGMVFRPRI